MPPNILPFQNPDDLHPLLVEAGVKPGDTVIWSPTLPLGGVPPKEMKVKGINLGSHDLNKGVPAIELTDEHGLGFRAYPNEIQKLIL